MTQDGSTYDLIIRGGTVFDGTGAPGVVADLAVRDGRVVALEANLEGSATREVDATGCWVSPGFFDMHAHYDAEI